MSHELHSTQESGTTHAPEAIGPGGEREESRGDAVSIVHPEPADLQAVVGDGVATVRIGEGTWVRHVEIVAAPVNG